MECSPDTKYYSTQFQISQPPSFLAQRPHSLCSKRTLRQERGKMEMRMEGRNGMANKLEKKRKEYTNKEMAK